MKQHMKKSDRERFWHGIPVRDATSTLRVQPMQEDIDKAIKGDPENCAYAMCIKRTMKATIVFIFKTVAYVQLLDEKGTPVLERYMIKDGPTRDYLNDFDAGKAINPGGFRLDVPSKCKTREYYDTKREKQTVNAERKREVKIKGIISPKKLPARETTGYFRDGTGMVKFIGIGLKLQKHQDKNS